MNTVGERKAALRDVLGSLAIEGQELDAASLRIFRRWVQGKITLEQLGSLFDDVIYDGHPEARIDPAVPLTYRRSGRPSAVGSMPE